MTKQKVKYQSVLCDCPSVYDPATVVQTRLPTVISFDIILEIGYVLQPGHKTLL